jgi:hypothetical protein
MADDQAQQQTSGDSQQDNDTPPIGGMVPYSRFKAVIDQRKALESKVAELTAQLAAPPSDEYRQKYEAAAAELTTLQRARLVDVALHRKGLPLDLARRVQGDTPEDIDADITELVRLGFGTVNAPNIDASAVNHRPPGFSLAQVSDAAFYRQNEAAIDRAAAEGRIYR